MTKNSTLPPILRKANSLWPIARPTPLTPVLSTLARLQPNSLLINIFPPPKGRVPLLCNSPRPLRSNPMRPSPPPISALRPLRPQCLCGSLSLLLRRCTRHSPLATASAGRQPAQAQPHRAKAGPLRSRPHSARIPPRLAFETFHRSPVSNTMSGPRLRRSAASAAQPTIASRPQVAVRRRGRKADRVRLG
jgi:hypothetical protein